MKCQIHVVMYMIMIFRESRVFKYVPLNSMTLANRKPTGEKKESSEAESESVSKDVKVTTKRPWWQNLPPKKQLFLGQIMFAKMVEILIF